MKLLAFAASHRPDSYNRKLVKIAVDDLSAQGIAVDFVEYGEFDMPVYNDAIAKTSGLPEAAYSFAKRAADADGIIISVPEYNWSYPGSLKNIIDWSSCIKPNKLAGKTVLLMSATLGKRGGIDCMKHLMPPLNYFKFSVFPDTFSLANCGDAFDANDHLADKNKHENLISVLHHYVTFTKNHANTK